MRLAPLNNIRLTVRGAFPFELNAVGLPYYQERGRPWVSRLLVKACAPQELPPNPADQTVEVLPPSTTRTTSPSNPASSSTNTTGTTRTGTHRTTHATGSGVH